MPTIDLGSVVGPQGAQGNTGPQGEQGVAGPSLISASTQTTLTGVLAGDGSTVGVRSVDPSPTNLSTNLVQSGGVYNLVKTDVAYAKSTTANPNILDNWYFVGGGSQQNGGQFPINQRAVTTRSVAQGYFIDRWTSYAALKYTAELQSGGMRVTGQSNAESLIQQNISDRIGNLNGKKVTFSILTDEDGLISDTVTLSLSASRTNKITLKGNNNRTIGLLTGDTTFLGAMIVAPTNSYVTVKAIKLELGETQTLCHNEGTTESPVWVLNEIPNYGEQYERCITSKADSGDTYANQTLATTNDIAKLSKYEVKNNVTTISLDITDFVSNYGIFWVLTGRHASSATCYGACGTASANNNGACVMASANLTSVSASVTSSGNTRTLTVSWSGSISYARLEAFA